MSSEPADTGERGSDSTRRADALDSAPARDPVGACGLSDLGESLMTLRTKLAVAAGAVVLVLGGAAAARVAGDCCKDCCDKMAAHAAPAAAR